MKAGLSFFNPQSSSSQSKSQSKQLLTRRRLIPIEAAHMDNSRVLLFVVPVPGSRSVAAMCEAAYHIGRQASSVVLCLQRMTEEAAAAEQGSGERLSKAALKDYNRGRAYLSDFANREGVPVFDEVREAVECVVRKCKEQGPHR